MWIMKPVVLNQADKEEYAHGKCKTHSKHVAHRTGTGYDVFSPRDEPAHV